MLGRVNESFPEMSLRKFGIRKSSCLAYSMTFYLISWLHKMTCNYTSFYQIARKMLNYSSIWHPLSVVFANEILAPCVMLYLLKANMQYPYIINLQLHFYHVVQHAIHFWSIIQGKQCNIHGRMYKHECHFSNLKRLRIVCV